MTCVGKFLPLLTGSNQVLLFQGTLKSDHKHFGPGLVKVAYRSSFWLISFSTRKFLFSHHLIYPVAIMFWLYCTSQESGLKTSINASIDMPKV